MQCIVTSRQDLAAVWREGDGTQCRSPLNARSTSRLGIPEPGGSGVAPPSGSWSRPARRRRHLRLHICFAERLQDRAALGLPELGGAVAASGQDLVSVRRERDGSTWPVCPLKVRRTAPVSASQSLAVLSRLPVRILAPFGEKATEDTPPGSTERSQDRSGAGIPKSSGIVDGIVGSCRGQNLGPVWREGDRQHLRWYVH